MLVRFSFENFRSFKTRQTFSMAAGKHTRLKNHLITANGKRILKGGIIFGANAAGKSNLIKAMSFSKSIIIDGVKALKTYENYFRIDSNFVKLPGVFQYDFISNGHIYSYGIVISYEKNIILSEWLYLCDDDKEFLIFERNFGEKIRTDIQFPNAELSQRFFIYADDVHDNKTFLSEIVEHKLEKIKEFSYFFDVSNWFDSLMIIFPTSKYSNWRQFMKNDKLSSLESLLHYFDTGIEEIQGTEIPMDEAFAFLPEEIKTDIIKDVKKSFESRKFGKNTAIEMGIAEQRYSFVMKETGEIVASQLLMNHGNKNDLFELKDESDGTKRLFDLIPIFQKGLENSVILVDELDRSFHTKLTVEFIKKFYEKTQNSASQLIVTTHDSNLLDLDILRQDEIWFVEREAEHNSILYSLSKFKERFDQSVDKAYLQGRYGSLPNFRYYEVE